MKRLFRNFCLASVVVVVSIVIAVGVSWVLAVWIEPATAPPGANVDAPVNVGPTDQYKTGKLGVATDGVDINFGLTVGNATNALGIKTDGPVRIGNLELRPVSATELGVYDSNGNLILIFD